MPQEDLFQIIAERHGFTLPEGCQQMEARGFSHLEHPSHASEFTRSGEGYLWLTGVEWLLPEVRGLPVMLAGG